MSEQNPERWRELAELASKEQDPKKLLELKQNKSTKFSKRTLASKRKPISGSQAYET